MTVPTHQELMKPVLVALEQHLELPHRELVELVAQDIGITPEQRQQTIASGMGLFENRVQWAVTYLVKAGAVTRPRRAVVGIADRGRQLLSGSQQINNALLDQFEEFREFRARSKKPADKGEAHGDSEISPQELLTRAEEEVNAVLQQELLDKARELPPASFERLVLRLLRAMGYGTEGSVDHTGKPGDGGFDGIVSQDPLGLDRIYVQAKRYASDNVVHRPEIQKFVGALFGAQGDRGVFITTSSYSAGSVAEADKVNARVELIDGERLAQLLVSFRVGVLPDVTVTLHRLDESFFEEL